MKNADIEKIDDDEICICINCLYKDVAKRWKVNKNQCVQCGSKAVLGYTRKKKSTVQTQDTEVKSENKKSINNGRKQKSIKKKKAIKRD